MRLWLIASLAEINWFLHNCLFYFGLIFTPISLSAHLRTKSYISWIIFIFLIPVSTFCWVLCRCCQNEDRYGGRGMAERLLKHLETDYDKEKWEAHSESQTSISISFSVHSMPISKTHFYIRLRKRSKSNSVISLCVIFVMQIVFSFQTQSKRQGWGKKGAFFPSCALSIRHQAMLEWQTVFEFETINSDGGVKQRVLESVRAPACLCTWAWRAIWFKTQESSF